MINQSKKAALIKYIKEQQTLGKPEILLPPDLFFDGYTDGRCTICVNISRPISTRCFLERVGAVQRKPEVSGIFVRFYDFLDAEEFEELWISGDSIYLITTANLDTVRRWFEDFEVSDVWIEQKASNFAGLPSMPEGSQLMAVWWD